MVKASFALIHDADDEFVLKSLVEKNLAVSRSNNVCRTLQFKSFSFLIVLLSISLAVLLENKAVAQNANRVDLSKYIRQLNDANERIVAIDALRKEGFPAIEALAKVVENSGQKPQTRLLAIYALGEVGISSQVGITALSTALHDSDQQVRLGAIRALGRMGGAATPVVPELAKALSDPNEEVRSASAYALSVIGPAAKEAVPVLIKALKDQQSEKVRLSAANALGRMDTEATTVVPALVEALKDPSEGVRLSAANALGQLGEKAKAAVPALMEAVKSDNKNVCSFAASALGRIGVEAKAAIPTLIEALKHPDRDVRLNAAVALGRMGSEARTALPALVVALRDADVGVHLSGASTLGKVAGSLQDEVKKLSTAELNQALSDLELALKAMESPSANVNEEVLAAVRRSVNALKTEQESRLLERMVNWVRTYPFVSGPLSYIAAILSVWVVLLRLRPLWLLRINELLKVSDLTIPLPAGNVTVSARLILLVNFFNYHPRVLDAWVAAHLRSVREDFQKKTTVHDRQVHVPLPVVLDGTMLTELSGKDLQSTFAKRRGCLLIWGEGGAGKTSLACQLAKWAMTDKPKRKSDNARRERLCDYPMLPVLLDHELNFELADGKKPFIEAIRGQLQALIGQADPISDELLDRLLRQRRILVIVDHFSEMNEATRKEIRPGHPDFPANALVVTSRTEETLDGVPKTTLRPLRIEGSRISSFMEAYLTQRGKRQFFDDPEYFDVCRRLSLMVGQRNITVLLAKMYAEQVIAAKEGKVKDGLPSNIPNLMLSYLNELHNSATNGEINYATVHRDAATIAWECLKETYRPATVKRKAVLSLLGGEDAETRVKHLEKQLRILQAVGPAQDRLCFALDPLAEYLAAWHLVETYGENWELWKQWLEQADSMPGAPDAIQGFLLAVRDCCLAKNTANKIPKFLLDELDKRVGMTRERSEMTQFGQQLQQMVTNLAASTSDDRISAIRNLKGMGRSAKVAIPDLLIALQDEAWQVRYEAVRAISEIGAEPEISISALVEALNDEDRRVSGEAVAILGKMGTAAIPTLAQALQHDCAHIRSSAAWTLAELGSAAKPLVPVLAEALADPDWQVRWVAAYALGSIGADASYAVPALLQALDTQYELVKKQVIWALEQICNTEFKAQTQFGGGLTVNG
jgi:HEAT repeat protein